MQIIQRPESAPPSHPSVVEAVRLQPWPFRDNLVKLRPGHKVITGDGELHTPSITDDDDTPYASRADFDILVHLADDTLAIAQSRGFEQYVGRNGWA